MRTTISISVSPSEIVKTKQLAKARGFRTTSDYVRFLIAEDDELLIGEDEILHRGREVERLARQSKLVSGKRLRDLMDD